MKWRSSFAILLFNFDYLPDEDGKKVDAKSEDEDEKIWKSDFDFWTFYNKIRLYDNFLENMRRKNLTHFLRHFWLIKAKMKMRMKKFRRMNLIFEFSISKLGYMTIFMKICGKIV